MRTLTRALTVGLLAMAASNVTAQTPADDPKDKIIFGPLGPITCALIKTCSETEDFQIIEQIHVEMAKENPFLKALADPPSQPVVICLSKETCANRLTDWSTTTSSLVTLATKAPSIAIGEPMLRAEPNVFACLTDPTCATAADSIVVEMLK